MKKKIKSKKSHNSNKQKSTNKLLKELRAYNEKWNKPSRESSINWLCNVYTKKEIIMYFKIKPKNKKDEASAKKLEAFLNFIYKKELSKKDSEKYDELAQYSDKTLDNIVKERIEDFEPKKQITVCTPYGHNVSYDQFIREINNDPTLSSNVVYYSDSDSLNKKEEDIWNMKELIKENLSEVNFKQQYLLEPECGKAKKKDQFGYIKRKQR